MSSSSIESGPDRAPELPAARGVRQRGAGQEPDRLRALYDRAARDPDAFWAEVGAI